MMAENSHGFQWNYLSKLADMEEKKIQLFFFKEK